MLVLLVSFQFPKFSAMHAVATITVATCFSIIIGIPNVIIAFHRP